MLFGVRHQVANAEHHPLPLSFRTERAVPLYHKRADTERAGELPFSYPVETEKKAGSSTAKPGLGDLPGSKEKGKNPNPMLRFGALAIGVAGIAGGAVLYKMVDDADSDIKRMKPFSINPETDAFYTEEERNAANERRKLLSAGSIGGFVLGGLGVTGFVVTLVF